MAADGDGDCDWLPMYVEEDEEEEAAAKQKRRQQSQNRLAGPTNKEIVKRNEHLARLMAEKVYDYDPKTDSICFTRVWCVDLDTFDYDEETQYGPMRFTDSLVRDDHVLTGSLNVLSLKIMSSDVGYPINVYGTVIVRDRLDMKCNYIFPCNRDNCQVVQSEGESLLLTGPSRGVIFRRDAYFEINLKIKEDEDSKDRQFSKTLVDVGFANTKSLVTRETVVSWLSEVDLIFAYVKKALEGTIEISVLCGPQAFYGKITVRTTDVPNHILLYDSDTDGTNRLGDNRVIQLLRRVVSVSVDQMLKFNIYARSGDQNVTVSHRSCDFTPLIKGADRKEITCGAYKLGIKVNWSTLIMRQG